MSLTLRAPELSDVPALTELMNQPGVIHGTLRLPFTPQSLAEARIKGRTERVHSLVAEMDGRAVGWASLLRREGRQSHAADFGISVHDAYAGKGVGTALTSALMDMADNWLGLVRVQLEVNVDNARGLALYKRFGFEVEGRLRADTLREGRLIDCFVMGRVRPAPVWANEAAP